MHRKSGAQKKIWKDTGLGQVVFSIFYVRACISVMKIFVHFENSSATRFNLHYENIESQCQYAMCAHRKTEEFFFNWFEFLIAFVKLWEWFAMAFYLGFEFGFFTLRLRQPHFKWRNTRHRAHTISVIFPPNKNSPSSHRRFSSRKSPCLRRQPTSHR